MTQPGQPPTAAVPSPSLPSPSPADSAIPSPPLPRRPLSALAKADASLSTFLMASHQSSLVFCNFHSSIVPVSFPSTSYTLDA